MRWRTHNEVTLRLWHDCFCLRPRKVGNTWVWMETVKRKGVLHVATKYSRLTLNGRVVRSMTWEYMMPEQYGR